VVLVVCMPAWCQPLAGAKPTAQHHWQHQHQRHRSDRHRQKHVGRVPAAAVGRTGRAALPRRQPL